MQTLNQDIKERSFRPVYLLYGEETFLVNSYKNRLKEAVLGDDTMNFSRYEGKGIDVSELIRQADTMPFFAEKRLILVEDSGFFKASSEELASYLPSMPDTTCIIFAESQVDKRNRLWDTQRKCSVRMRLSLPVGPVEFLPEKGGKLQAAQWNCF